MGSNDTNNNNTFYTSESQNNDIRDPNLQTRNK